MYLKLNKLFIILETLKVGDTLPGVVIARDFDKQFVYLCLKQSISGKINPLQDGNLKEATASSLATKLVVEDECVISVLKHPNGNKQLVYLPTKVHENDFKGCMSYYEKKQFKICLCG